MEKYDENMFKIETRGTDYVLTRVTDKEITDCTIPNFVTKIERAFYGFEKLEKEFDVDKYKIITSFDFKDIFFESIEKALKSLG